MLFSILELFLFHLYKHFANCSKSPHAQHRPYVFEKMVWMYEWMYARHYIVISVRAQLNQHHLYSRFSCKFVFLPFVFLCDSTLCPICLVYIPYFFAFSRESHWFGFSYCMFFMKFFSLFCRLSRPCKIDIARPQAGKLRQTVPFWSLLQQPGI